jgi:hypothetical protein
LENAIRIVLVFAALALLVASAVLHPDFGAAYACPPGLAKKDPPCVPPGQARRGGSDDDWRHHDGGRHVVDRDDLYFLDDYNRYDLPSLPYGQRYAVVDDQIVVIDAESYEILQLIRVFTALAN